MSEATNMSSCEAVRPRWNSTYAQAASFWVLCSKMTSDEPPSLEACDAALFPCREPDDAPLAGGVGRDPALEEGAHPDGAGVRRDGRRVEVAVPGVGPLLGVDGQAFLPEAAHELEDLEDALVAIQDARCRRRRCSRRRAAT
jgi:hypothetical protein